MAFEDSLSAAQKVSLQQSRRQRFTYPGWPPFPGGWCFILLLIVGTVLLITNSPTYNEAFVTIRSGMIVTLYITLISYTISLLIGLFTGLGRVSSSIFVPKYRNILRGTHARYSHVGIDLLYCPGHGTGCV